MFSDLNSSAKDDEGEEKGWEEEEEAEAFGRMAWSCCGAARGVRVNLYMYT